jgi:hypothetical protein
MKGREQEIRHVAGELNALLDDLKQAVDGLNAILTAPPPDTADTEALTP